MTLGAVTTFLICAFVAEVIGTMAGFGAATVLTPIAIFFVDIKTAVAIVAAFHLCGNASRLYFFGRHIRWRIVWQFGLAGVACSLAGAELASRVSAAALQVALGAFLLVYVALALSRLPALRLPARRSTLLIGAVASGTIAGLIGTGWAIRSVCLLAFGLPKDAYLGTSALIALVVDATRLPVYVAQGFLPRAMAPVMAGLVGIAFAGAWTGQRLVRRVSPEGFKRLVLAMLAAMGVKLLIDGLR